MIRSKAFKAYERGSWKIHSLYVDNNWKVDWGKNTCWYCGSPTAECGKLTVDHILPRVKQGDDSFDNVAYACGRCNSSKGYTDLIEWLCEKKQYKPFSD